MKALWWVKLYFFRVFRRKFRKKYNLRSDSGQIRSNEVNLERLVRGIHHTTERPPYYIVVNRIT